MLQYNKIRFWIVLILLGTSLLSIGQTATVSGTVTTVYGNPLDLVEISTDDGQFSTTSDVNGNYSLELPVSAAYTLVFERNTDLKEGISMRDMFRMYKHILGIEDLDYFEKVASDLNNDGNITTFDVITLQRLLILDIPPTSPNWRLLFVDTNGDLFVNITTGLLQSDLPNMNIVGVKTGNLDCH